MIYIFNLLTPPPPPPPPPNSIPRTYPEVHLVLSFSLLIVHLLNIIQEIIIAIIIILVVVEDNCFKNIMDIGIIRIRQRINMNINRNRKRRKMFWMVHWTNIFIYFCSRIIRSKIWRRRRMDNGIRQRIVQVITMIIIIIIIRE